MVKPKAKGKRKPPDPLIDVRITRKKSEIAVKRSVDEIDDLYQKVVDRLEIVKKRLKDVAESQASIGSDIDSTFWKMAFKVAIDGELDVPQDNKVIPKFLIDVLASMPSANRGKARSDPNPEGDKALTHSTSSDSTGLP